MYAYHSASDANQLLNILDAECQGVVRGIEKAVLAFKWRFIGLADSLLPGAIDTLVREELLRESGSQLRLTGLGYRRLTAPDVATMPDAPLPATAAAFGRPTEYGIRNKLLGVFRSQDLGEGGKLSAGELNRYWAVAGYRSADLRSGLDLLMRDGHSKVGRFSKTMFRLERDGHQYVRGSEAPPWLAAEAVALEQDNLAQQGIPDRVLCVLAARQFLQSNGQLRERTWSEVDYLLERYELPELARFHAYELLHRLGYAEAAEGKLLRLTTKGYEMVANSDHEVVQWSIRQALKQGSSDRSTALPRAAE